MFLAHDHEEQKVVNRCKMTSTDKQTMELKAQIQQYLVESGNYEK